ncbi:hypothetical protein D3C72_2363250 [compost metagenome]
MKEEFLFQQAHIDRFDLDQVNLGITVVTVQPTGTPSQLQYQKAEQQQTGHWR